MKSNRSSSSINSYTFSSIGSITSINLMKPSIRQFPFLLILIPSLISLIAISPSVANSTSQKNQEKFTQLANICFVTFQCIVSFLENFLVQTAPLNLSVIPLLSSYLSIICLIPFSHNFHAIIPWIPSVPSIIQFQLSDPFFGLFFGDFWGREPDLHSEFSDWVFSATFWHEITLYAIDIDKKRFRTPFLTL